MRLDSGTAVAHGTTNRLGAFTIGFTSPEETIGRHQLTATCGSLTLLAPVDYVTTASLSGAAPAPAATVGAVFLFFILLGIAILRRSGRVPMRTPGA
jgi:hypothetical protein